MKLTIIIFTFFLVVAINCKTFQVSSDQELNDALNQANPGDVINLQDRNYNGKFTATKSGQNGNPITIKGSKGAKLQGSYYGFWLKASYWKLQGFSVLNSKKGIVIEGGSHNLLDNLEVAHIQEEGIHFRYNSPDNILQNSYIHDTGLGNPGFGEGVYLGQAVSNWQGGQPDRSDRIKVLNNRIGPNVAAECIDIKEGSCCGLIQGNTFDGTGEKGQHSADSWVDVKGDKYVITNNKGSNPFKDGFQIHHISEAGMGGCGNTITNNHCSGIPSGGKCVTNASKDCSNTVKENN